MADYVMYLDDRRRVGQLNEFSHSQDLSGRGVARAEDAQGTPTQSQILPSILVDEDKIDSQSPHSVMYRRSGGSLQCVWRPQVYVLTLSVHGGITELGSD